MDEITFNDKDPVKKPFSFKNMSAAMQNGIKSKNVEFLIGAAGDLLREYHTGGAADFTRKMGGKSKLAKTVKESYKFGNDIGKEKGFDTAKRRARIMQALPILLGENRGKKIAANVARKTKQGVCYDSSCVIEEDLKRLKPNLYTEKVSGGLLQFNKKTKKNEYAGHAVVVHGSDKLGYQVLDALNNNKDYIRDPKTGFIIKDRKRAKEVLAKGIPFFGTTFRSE